MSVYLNGGICLSSVRPAGKLAIVDNGLNSLVSFLGFLNCKKPCFAWNNNPFGDAKNLPIRTTSSFVLSALVTIPPLPNKSSNGLSAYLSPISFVMNGSSSP